jgi:hypothetical protein
MVTLPAIFQDPVSSAITRLNETIITRFGTIAAGNFRGFPIDGEVFD